MISVFLALTIGYVITPDSGGSPAQAYGQENEGHQAISAKYEEVLLGVVSFTPVEDHEGKLTCVIPVEPPSEDVDYLQFNVSRAPVIGDLVVRPAIMAVSSVQEFTASYSTHTIWLSPCAPISQSSDYQIITGNSRPGIILLESKYVANHSTTDFAITLLEIDVTLKTEKTEDGVVLTDRPETTFPVARGHVDKIVEKGTSPIRFYENGLHLGHH